MINENDATFTYSKKLKQDFFKKIKSVFTHLTVVVSDQVGSDSHQAF